MKSSRFYQRKVRQKGLKNTSSANNELTFPADDVTAGTADISIMELFCAILDRISLTFHL